jgi:hypothetical protein
MKLFRVCAFFWVAGHATVAWAQLGLYGAPETLRLTPVQPGPFAQPLPGPATSAPGMFVQTSAEVQPNVMPRQPWTVAPAQVPPRTTQPPAVTYPMLGPAGEMPGNPAAPPTWGCGAGCAAPAGCENPPACGVCENSPCNPWYASVFALSLTRNGANKLWTTFEFDNQPHQMMNTQDIDLEWGWGGEVRVGRYFCCNQWALEASFWTVTPLEGEASVTSPSNVSTVLTTGHTFFGPDSAFGWFNYAGEQHLSRHDEAYNLELNLVRSRLVGGCGPWGVDLSAGVRYFRFRDHLIFGSVQDGCTWEDYKNTNLAAYVDDDVTNNLIGLQLGFNVEYCVTPCCRLFVTPKVGVYDNFIRNDFQMYLGDRSVQATQSEYPGDTYPVNSSRNAFSFLTQVDVGVTWQITPRWDAQIGYRVVAATGIGLADNQIPQDVVDIPAIRDIKHNGDLVLHGAFIGTTFRF